MEQGDQRPCKLPKIQIDTWGAARARTRTYQAEELARDLCSNAYLLLESMLKCTHARTLSEFVHTIHLLEQPLNVHLRAGQIYMHDKWRIRFKDMSLRMQEMVLDLRDPEHLGDHVATHYRPRMIIDELFTQVGPARAEGIRALLGSLRGHHAPCALPRAPRSEDR